MFNYLFHCFNYLSTRVPPLKSSIQKTKREGAFSFFSLVLDCLSCQRRSSTRATPFSGPYPCLLNPESDRQLSRHMRKWWTAGVCMMVYAGHYSLGTFWIQSVSFNIFFENNFYAIFWHYLFSGQNTQWSQSKRRFHLGRTAGLCRRTWFPSSRPLWPGTLRG